MSDVLRAVVALLVATGGLATPALAQPQKALGWKDLLHRSESVLFTPRQTRALLQHPLLQFGSEVVRHGDEILLRNEDYGIDYARGALFLLRPPADSLRVQVDYLSLPGPQERRFQALTILSREEVLGQTEATPASPVSTAALVPRDVGLPPGLQLVGSKTIGVSFGRNREASLEQSLRVQVSGSLGEDLRVNAVLSDDNLPVVPEGNTEELGDLDRVFIEMQGPVVGGVVGDFDLLRPQGTFSRFERQLRGAEVRARLHGQEVAVGGGLSRGELQTLTFRGTEGKQGPYELLSARRVVASTVLPGSERVYVDGQLMRRGENQDYVVDYVRGELRFTSRRRITEDSEISVDYQVTTESYRRETRQGRFGLQRRDWMLSGIVVEEGDDRDAPVGRPLTPEEIAVLSEAGDEAAVAAGIRPVAPGEGSYRYDLTDSTIVVYDPAGGDLKVDFYEAGASQGSYEDRLDALTGRRYFEFVGSGQGTFAVGRLLQPPVRNRLVSTTLDGRPWQGGRIAGEAAFSIFDGNLFSAQQDADNLGEALDLQFDALDRGFDFGRLAWNVHFSQLSPRFKSLGRTRPGFYYKEWNAEQDTLRSTERITESTLRYGLGGETPWLKLAANLGRLDRGEDLDTRRGQVDVDLGRGERGIEAHWQRLDTDRPVLGADAGRLRSFVRGGARYRLGPFLPEVRLERDEFRRAAVDSFVRQSYRYLDAQTRLGIGGPRLLAALEFGRRDTDEAGTQDGVLWQPSRRNETYGFSLVGRPSRSWNTEVAWSRRTNQPRGQNDATGSQTDLARLQLRFDPAAHAVRAELRYELSDNEIRKLEQVLVPSPDGKGDYDAEGRPVGKDQGEYDKVYRYLGDTEGVQEVAASLRFELGRSSFRPRPEAGRSWWKRNLAFLQVLSVQEQTRDAADGIYWLQPSAFQSEATVFGSFRARQEWSFLESSLDRSLRLLLDWEDDLDGRFGGERIDSQRRRANLRFERSGTHRWSWAAEGELGRRDRRGQLDAVVPGRPSSSTFAIRQQRLLGSVAFRPTPSERLAVETAATRQVDRESEVLQTLLSVTPSTVLAPARNLRLLGSVTLTRVFEDNPSGALPPYLFDAPGTKTTLTVTGSYRLARILNLNLTATSVRNTDGRSTYDVRMETRAVF